MDEQSEGRGIDEDHSWDIIGENHWIDRRNRELEGRGIPALN